ncbi:MAG: PocR ligand-binding domain-containing protein [Ardenticatenaceae bacterium]|nr:PocR ligand-binding domain-containing protein [Ardenticatenaceae bacterium]
MSDYLTTNQVQTLLQIDRTTVYRMLGDGRLRGVKIGNRWRFCKSKIDNLLADAPPVSEPPVSSSVETLPRTCLQGIQAVSAEAMDISAIITNAAGEPITQISNPCHFCQLMLASEKGRAACLSDFSSIAQQTGSASAQITCHAGLQCVGLPIMINGEKSAVFITGQYQSAAQPAPAHNLQQLAAAYDLDGAALETAVADIPVFNHAKQQKIFAWLPKLTQALSEISQERAELLDRLQRIAAMSTIG